MESVLIPSLFIITSVLIIYKRSFLFFSPFLYWIKENSMATLANHNICDKTQNKQVSSPTMLHWISDAEDKKSTVGYVFMLGGAGVGWSSRKEPVVVLSSCETEYITTSLCACQATWM